MAKKPNKPTDETTEQSEEGLGVALELEPSDWLEQDMVPLLRKDARRAVASLAAAGGEGLTVVRYLVQTYYDHQHNRIEAANRLRASNKANAPSAVMDWLLGRDEQTEKAVRAILEEYVKVEPTGMGEWAMLTVGIGPVLSAGLLSLIDMNKATNPSKIWRFFGLDPSVKWVKGQKRPWSAMGKTLCWKIGDSFVKFHNRDDCFYGKLYEQFKAREQELNANGSYAATAARTLEERAIKDKDLKACYQSGKLPDGRIELRARRKAVKIFLVHWWEEAWTRKWGTPPVKKAYVFDKLGHESEIKNPNAGAGMQAE